MHQELQRSSMVSEDKIKLELKLKLLKLVISSSTITFIHLFRFWNPFKTRIEELTIITTRSHTL